MKKVCIVMPVHWSSSLGGAEYQAKLLADALYNTGRCKVFCLAGSINIRDKSTEYSSINIASKISCRKYSKSFDTPALLRSLKEIEPDIIYQRDGGAYTGITAYYAKKNNCKMVWHIAHEWDVSPIELKPLKTWPFRFIDKQMLNYGIRHSSQIIAQNQTQKVLLEKGFKRDATVVANFHPKPTGCLKKGNELKIVWVANFKEWKRPEIFIQLAKELVNVENVRFIMVGKPMQNKKAFTKLLKSINSSKNLDYLGEINQEEVNSVLEESDIFVNTSRYEGFPNTFIQAWMRKNVVVSLNVNPDNILDQYHIGLFADDSFEKLKANVTYLIRNNEIRKKIAARGQAYAYKEHSMNNVNKLIKYLIT